MNKILVTYKTTAEEKEFLTKFFPDETNIDYLQEYPDKERGILFQSADILLSWNPKSEGLNSPNISYRNVKFIQLLSAGYDHIDLSLLPANIKVAANQGAYSEPMAEHILA
ncbi:MAG: hydroxyacid dehydrogenase, partial [Chloroherpetonaceae bacterium]